LSAKHLFGIQFRPKFSITADLDSKYVLDAIKTYFNCGKVSINLKNHSSEFLVEKLEDLKTVIIPHFISSPVFCAKLHAFNLFKEIVIALINKQKRTIEGRRELLKMALSMNKTNNRTIDRIDLLFALLGITDNKDKNLIIYNNTQNSTDFSLTPEFLSGVIDGDGSFFISFHKDGKIKTGFSVTTDNESRALLESLQSELKNIGTINEGSKNELIYTVTGLNQITEVLIPFMNKWPLFSERSSHFSKFETVSLILKKEQNLSLETKLDIVELCYNMNKKGKRRNLSKTQYIDLLKKLYIQN